MKFVSAYIAYIAHMLQTIFLQVLLIICNGFNIRRAKKNRKERKLAIFGVTVSLNAKPFNKGFFKEY